MISIIRSHFIARDVIRFWITAQSNFNDISKYIKYSTSFDAPLLRVTHFPLGFIKYMKTCGSPYRNQAMELIAICRVFSRAAKQVFSQDAELIE